MRSSLSTLATRDEGQNEASVLFVATTIVLGMLNYMKFWFSAFLFGGFLLAENDIPWPFLLFHAILLLPSLPNVQPVD